MKYNCQGEYNNRPYNATTQITSLPAVDIAIAGTVSATADVYVPSSLKLDAGVVRDISQKITTAKIRYNKALNGGIYSGEFYKKIVISMFDHLNVSHTIFVGEFHGDNATLQPGGNSEEFTAEDNCSYLANNPLDDDQLAFLKPSAQDTSVYQRLDYDYVVNNFTVGKLIQGATSGALAKVIATQGTWLYSSTMPPEQYLVPISAIVIGNIVGTFVDDETITEIGGPGEALVNGTATIPLDFGPGTIYPETWVYNLLGGANWQKITGIYPKRINPTHPISVTWDQAPWDNWTFQQEEKKQQALDEVSEYHNFVFVVKYESVAGYTQPIPCAYWVHQDDIDNPEDYALTEHCGLNLPAAVTITSGKASGLVPPVALDIQGTARRNKIRVIGQDVSGNVFENVQVPDLPGTTEGTATESAGVYYGEELPLIYIDPMEIKTWSTQALCQSRAALLYASLSLKISTWKATFVKRADLEYYQKITFSGYDSNEIPDGDYRIIRIEYDDQSAASFVTVILVSDDQFIAQVKMNRTLTNSYLEIKRTIQYINALRPQIYAGTVTAADGNEITGTSEGGQSAITRTLT
jgi:hypothetical protein